MIIRDEMPNLLAADPDAARLAALTRTLSEQLLATPGWLPPRLDRKAVFHTHCHHKALFDVQAEQKVLEAMGLELEKPQVGCCGHAGVWR